MKVVPYFFASLVFLQSALCCSMDQQPDHAELARRTALQAAFHSAIESMRINYNNIRMLEQQLADQGVVGQDHHIKQLKAMGAHAHKEAIDILNKETLLIEKERLLTQKLIGSPIKQNERDALQLLVDNKKQLFLASFPKHNKIMNEGYTCIKRSATPHPAPAPSEREAS